MARNRFGGDAASWLFSTSGNVVVVPGPGHSVTAWSGPADDLDRTEYADLRAVDDAATVVTAVPVIASGQVPEFDGPDDPGVTKLWISADDGATGVWITTTTISKAAATGSYTDLAGKPTIPTTPGEVGADAAGAATAAVSGHVAATDPHGDRTYADGQVSTERSRAQGVEAAKADLVGGKVPSSQIPSIALEHGVITVANAAARYALVLHSTIELGQPVVQASTGQTFLLVDGATDPSQSGQWIEIPAIGKVQSVNGSQGAVVLAAGDVGAEPTIAAPGSAPTGKYLRGDKTWQDLAGDPGLSAAFAQRWQATHAYLANDLALAPDGTIIQRNTDGTSRASYDATEQALWTAKTGGVTAEVTRATNAEIPIAYTGTVRGAWAGGTVYAVGDVVTVESGLVRATTAHTSNAAGFTYDRDKWEVIAIPGLHGASTVRVRHLDLTNAGATGTPVPAAGLFQRRPKRFNYKAERILWSVQQASDITVTGGSVATGTGKPLGSAVVTCNTSGTMNATLPTRTAFDVTGGFFRVPLTLSDPSNRYFELQISSDGAWTNYHAAPLLYSSNDSIPGLAKVAMYGIPVSEMTAVGTGATLTAITAARIQNSNGSPALTMEVERIAWHPNTSDKAKVVLWFDDGGLTNQTAAMKVLAKYGFPPTIAAIANNLTNSGSTLNGDAARHLQNVYGAQIAVHAYGGNDHNISMQTGQPILEQLLDYQHFEQAMGFSGGDDLAYWNPGLTQQTTLADEVTIRKLFRSARTTAGRFPETLPPIDPYRTIAYNGSTNTAMQAIVTRAIAYKGCAQFLWHSLSAGNLTELTTFAAWLDTQRANLDVVTAAGAFDPLCV